MLGSFACAPARLAWPGLACRQPTDSDGALIKLDRVALVVPQAEVARYLQASLAANSSGGASAKGRALAQARPWDWLLSSTVHSYDALNGSWVYYSYLSTPRMSGTRVNITSVPPDATTLMLPRDEDDDNPAGLAAPAPASDSNVNKKEVILWSLFAITLPTAFGVGLVVFLWARRRRLARLCSRGETGKAERGVEEGGSEPPCMALAVRTGSDGGQGPKATQGSAVAREAQPACVPQLFTVLMMRSKRSEKVRGGAGGGVGCADILLCGSCQ